MFQQRNKEGTYPPTTNMNKLKRSWNEVAHPDALYTQSFMNNKLFVEMPKLKKPMMEKEKTRTASVNDAFLMLRTLIPTEPLNRKLSKIETLRLASSYISHLHAVLVTGVPSPEQPCLRHHLAMNTDNSPIHPYHYSMNQSTAPKTSARGYRPMCTFCVTELKQHQQAIKQFNAPHR